MASCPALHDWKNALARDGYVFLERWHPNITIDQLATQSGRQQYFQGHGQSEKLVPRESTDPNNYSGIFGLNAFPLHTDMAHWPNPPRYLMLRCVKGHGEVSTDLLDSIEIIKLVGRSMLSRSLVKPRRPLN